MTIEFIDQHTTMADYNTKEAVLSLGTIHPELDEVNEPPPAKNLEG
jgi:hypothetical protein